GLVVDGLGSTLVAHASSPSSWDGSPSGVTLSNGATGTFGGGINMATTADGANVSVQVQSGAQLSVGNLSVASASFNGNAAITVTDPGSALTLSPSANLVIGDAVGGTATINVNNGATLSVGAGGTTTLNATGALNINGGAANLKTLSFNGGS